MNMTLTEAIEHLKRQEAFGEEKGLFNLGWYLSWEEGRGTAVLDGEFTARDLMAIALVMEQQ